MIAVNDMTYSVVNLLVGMVGHVQGMHLDRLPGIVRHGGISFGQLIKRRVHFKKSIGSDEIGKERQKRKKNTERKLITKKTSREGKRNIP